MHWHIEVWSFSPFLVEFARFKIVDVVNVQRKPFSTTFHNPTESTKLLNISIGGKIVQEL